MRTSPHLSSGHGRESSAAGYSCNHAGVEGSRRLHLDLTRGNATTDRPRLDPPRGARRRTAPPRPSSASADRGQSWPDEPGCRAVIAADDRDVVRNGNARLGERGGRRQGVLVVERVNGAGAVRAPNRRHHRRTRPCPGAPAGAPRSTSSLTPRADAAAAAPRSRSCADSRSPPASVDGISARIRPCPRAARSTAPARPTDAWSNTSAGSAWTRRRADPFTARAPWRRQPVHPFRRQVLRQRDHAHRPSPRSRTHRADRPLRRRDPCAPAACSRAA